MMRVSCPKCDAVYDVKDALAGKSLPCRKCGSLLSIPAAAAEPAAPAGADLEWTSADMEKVGRLRQANENILEQLRKAVVGQDAVVRLTMLGLFAQGHCLLMGVPGLGKTLLVRSLSSCLSLAFKRVQFTPDLMPSDITGTEVIQEDKATGDRHFKFLDGPI